MKTALILALAVASTATVIDANAQTYQWKDSSGRTVISDTPPPASVRGLPDFTDLVEQVGPSVVNIRTMERVRPGGSEDGSNDEDMREFFRRFFGVRNHRRRPHQNAAEQGTPQNPFPFHPSGTLHPLNPRKFIIKVNTP